MTNVLVMVVTAYCSCRLCCGKWSAYGLTADGHRPVQGVTCAANRAPFGTRLRIEGVGERVVQDRMARRFGDRVDVYFARHEDARRFGVRKLRVSIIKP